MFYHVVKWELPAIEELKCNIDGASKWNPGPSSYGFYIRDHGGDLVYVQAGVLGQTTNIQVKATAILEALTFWENSLNQKKTLETDSLTLIKIIKGVWRVPWELAKMVEKIKKKLIKQWVTLQHIFREGNQLANYLANHAVEEGRKMKFHNFGELPTKGRNILNTDKYQIPTIRIRTRRIKLQQA